MRRLAFSGMPTTGASPHQMAAGGSGGLVLVLNSGSSSVKFALLLPGSGERVMVGIGERLGTAEALLRVQWFPAEAVEERLSEGTHRAVVAGVLDQLAETGPADVQLLGAGEPHHYAIFAPGDAESLGTHPTQARGLRNPVRAWRATSGR